MSATDDVQRTTRGFAIYDEFEDMYGGTVRIQESSNIEGGVWLFYDWPNNGKIDKATGKTIIGAPHLSEEQARRTIRALRAYLRRRRA